MKKRIGLIVGIIVIGFLLLSFVRTYVVLRTDIDDTKVEAIATALKLVTAQEENYPSLLEMEGRIQHYRAGEVFTDMNIQLALVLCISILFLSVGLSFYKMLNNKQRLIRFAIPAAALTLLFVVNGLTADTQLTVETTNTASKNELAAVSALISSTVFLLIISVVFLVAINLQKMLKR